MFGIHGCFFPTTVVLVDDNSLFLDGLSACLQVRNSILKSFDDCDAALAFLNDRSQKNLSIEELMIEGEEGTSDWKSMLFNVHGIHKEIYNHNRFNRISTVTVDYSMPAMNGLEFIQKIKNKSIKKILLTGMADEKIAIQAFNDDLIDGYIKKGDANFEDTLTVNIEKCMNNYFSGYSKAIENSLSVYGKSHFQDPIFANFLNKIWNSSNFVEYYLLDSVGSYLLVQKNGNLTCLFVYTESEMEKLIESAKSSGEYIDELIQALESREFILSFYNSKGMFPPVKEWHSYLYPAKQLNGYQTYYWAIKNVPNTDIDIGDILSYNEFLKLNFGMFKNRDF